MNSLYTRIYLESGAHLIDETPPAPSSILATQFYVSAARISSSSREGDFLISTYPRLA